MTFDQRGLFCQMKTGLPRQIGLGALAACTLAVMTFGLSESPAPIPDDEYVAR
jgi:hypothetical protein